MLFTGTVGARLVGDNSPTSPAEQTAKQNSRTELSERPSKKVDVVLGAELPGGQFRRKNLKL